MAPSGSDGRDIAKSLGANQRIDDTVCWRSSEDLPPSSRYIGSPYDEQAHYGKKRGTQWVGYKVHLIETCEAHLPLLIPHGETTTAPIADDDMTAIIHAELERKELLPDKHIMDMGYIDAQLLEESQRARTRNGKRLRKQASIPIIFPLIGKNNRHLSRGKDQHQLDSVDRPSEKQGAQDHVLDD